MISKRVKPFAGAFGAAFIASTAVPLASADVTQPFAANPLSAGYELANFDQHKPMDQGMDSGGKADKEGNCGGSKTEAAGKSTDDSGMKHDDPAMSSSKSGKEGKCGDAKCGANKGK